MKCTACGTSNPENAKFCSECGARFGSTAVHARAEDLRRVTVVFSDLSGYTAMSEHLGPEETKAITSRVFGEVSMIARKYDGRVDRLIGDCALILFGIPHVHEDDALRALDAAMEVHTFVDTLNSDTLTARIGRRLAMHTGVNTGTVLAGQTDIEAGSESVVGDPVNLASRLKDAARAGQILVGPLSWRLTREDLDYRPLEPLSLKGKEKPVQAYELLTRKPKAARPGALNREVYSQLVGRAEELGLLEQQVRKVAAGEGSIVFVRGEAGVGKSRLLAELRRKDVMAEVVLLEGSAQSIGKNLGFHPFIEMLDGWAGIREGDGETEAWRKLEAAVLGAAREGGEEILPFVAVMRGLKPEGVYADRVKDLPGDALAKLIAKSVRDLFCALSRQKPVVLVLEDFHWADESSLDLLEGLFRLVGKERVCFVAALRPSLPNTERLLGKAQKAYPGHGVLIDLSTLSGPESEQMVCSLLRNRAVSRSILDSLVERTGGNPFFIEEIVRSWIDEGSVRVSEQGFQISERIGQTDMPYTVHQAIMARIDRLEEETREVLRIAAVIGRSFFYRIIAQLAGKAESVDSRIEYLKGIQLIVERKRLEEVEYLFKHALVQQAIYDSILVQARKKLHSSVAQAIETIFARRLPEFYGILAYHHSKAEDFVRARENMILAGEEAMKASASNEAIRYFKEALDTYLARHDAEVDPKEVAVLEKNLAIAYLNKGLHPESIEHLTTVLRMHGFSDPKVAPVRIIVLAIKLISCLRSVYLPLWNWKRRPSENDLELLNLVLLKGECLFNTDPKGVIVHFINAFFFVRNFDLSYVPAGHAMLSTAAMSCDVAGISLSLSNTILRFLGNKTRADDIRSRIQNEPCVAIHGYLTGKWSRWRFDEALIEANLRRGELFLTSNYLMWTGRIFIQRGLFPEAETLVRWLADIAGAYANDFAQTLCYLLHTSVLVQTRRLESAHAEVDQAIEFVKSTGFRMMHFMLNNLKIRILTLRGDLAAADLTLAAGLRMDRETGAYPHYRSGLFLAALNYYLVRLEESATAADGKGAARYDKLFLASLKRERRLLGKVAPDRPEAYRITGSYYWIRGRTRMALRWWRASLKESERLGARLELSRNYAEAGKRIVRALSSGTFSTRKGQLLSRTARDHLRCTELECLGKAEVLFKEMNLPRDLEELRAARPHFSGG